MPVVNGVELTGTPLTKLGEQTEKYLFAVFQSGRRVAIEQAEDMEAWAKENAPWTDRTGKAREGLKATVEPTGPIGTIILQHDPDLDYTIWLELAYQGKWAILTPARDFWGPVIRRSMQNLVNLKLATFGEEGPR